MMVRCYPSIKWACRSPFLKSWLQRLKQQRFNGGLRHYLTGKSRKERHTQPGNSASCWAFASRPVIGRSGWHSSLLALFCAAWDWDLKGLPHWGTNVR